MFNRRIDLVAALAGLAGALTTGAERLTQVAVANDNFRSFSQRYGNNPRSLNGNSNGNRNSKTAQQKRAAVKRRNIAKHPRSTLNRKRRA